MVASIPTAAELVAGVAAAQESLRRAAERMGSRRDEARLWLLAQSDALGVLLKTTRRWEGAVGEVIEASKPLTADEIEALAQRLENTVCKAAKKANPIEMRKAAARVVHESRRATAVRSGLTVSAAFVAGCLLAALVFWQAGAGPWANAAAVAKVGTDPASGRRYVVMWTCDTTPSGTAR